jgi:hypothetical protein
MVGGAKRRRHANVKTTERYPRLGRRTERLAARLSLKIVKDVTGIDLGNLEPALGLEPRTC